ncbi:MAG TPA: aspartate/glutamate racemase family protein [bacterium]|nr:aspartate/glutamate racemase family protein [bacterium]
MRIETGPVVVIGGGVGPMAGVALHALIISNTLTDGTDQSHLTVHHYSCSARIPDRTEYLLDHGKDDPALAMAQVFKLAARALDGRTAVGGVPCNTFHAPLIFDGFLAILAESGVGIRIVNMLEETMLTLRQRLPGSASEKIGVLSTTGTRRSAVYDRLLEASGFEPLYVPESSQQLLHASIYDRTWGLKATPKPTDRAIEIVTTMASELVGRGAAALVLACTELPLALGGSQFQTVPLVDPMVSLARALIREAAPDKLAPL